MRGIVAMVVAIAYLSQAAAQGQERSKLVTQLLADGYEIKSTAFFGTFFIILQKQTSAYICQTLDLTKGGMAEASTVGNMVRTAPCFALH
jgi:hypothetical protein